MGLRLLSRGLLLGAVVLGGGCPFLPSGGGTGSDGGGGIERCEMDAYQCTEAQIEIDDTCELEGELQVEIGQGVDVFEDFAVGEIPGVYTAGGFQAAGTSHSVAAVRVSGLALDRYQEVGVYIQLFDAEDCAGRDECLGGHDYGARQVVVGSLEPLIEVDPGVIEAPGITYLSQWGQAEGDVVIEATVVDPCGRTGTARHQFTPRR